ncbi:hypothetical protein D3C84_590120 [compost metagenome]
MELAIGRQPMGADLQHQYCRAADHAQYVAQVITVQRAQRAFFSFADAVHQHRGIGRDQIAFHQLQRAVAVVAHLDFFAKVAEQRTAVIGVVPHQIGRAHKRAAGDLLA